MLIIAFLFLILANIVNHSKGIKNDVKITFLLIIYLWLIVIFTFRDTSIPDTVTYIQSYNNPEQSDFEFLFSLVSQITSSIGLSFNGFLFVYEIILFGLWFYTSKKIFSDIHLAFMVFLPFMGIYNYGIIIRAGMGLNLCYFALISLLNNKTFKGYIFYYLLVTVAFFFHQSMLVFFILPLYVLKKYNIIILTFIAFISIIIPSLNIQRYIANIIEFFINLFSSKQFLSYISIHANYDIQGVYSLTMIKYFIMGFIFLGLRTKVFEEKKELYNCFLNIYISGILLIALTYFISAGNRLSYMFFYFEFVLVGILYEYSNLPKKLVFMGAIGLSILNYLNLISAVPEMLTY